ncbi:hypothetical protein [Kosmotoga pacifica]|uniref:Uncharacterized protein n=1 Tax=Kosmotoga pacifica TaxID=1330330 RepID=A0A0G2ZAH9_9BACT|nr:hypothetical protein [Kosmotoga pacifica]AKI96584.1 hypothetical protein IX53_00720 [Kosmotoga pacifica]
MAISTIVKNKRDGKLIIKDGNATTPASFEVAFAEGDFTFTPPAEGDPIIVKDKKGAFAHAKKGDALANLGKVSFSFKYCDKNAYEALTCGTVDGVAWVSTSDGDATIPYDTVDIVYEIYADDGVTVEETYTFTKVWFNPGNIQFKEGEEANTMSAEGVIFGTWSVT